MAEIWCGVQSIVRAAKSRGLGAQGFDIKRVVDVTDDAKSEMSEDILSVAGFVNAVKLVMQLKSGGLLWMAPVCSSSVFPNSSNTLRTKDNPTGNLGYRPVLEGNQMALTAALLAEVAVQRGVHCCIASSSGLSRCCM